MTSSLPICEKLRAEEFVALYGDPHGGMTLANPDGPEAADLLDLLTEALEEALVFVEEVERREDTHYLVGGVIHSALAKVRQHA